MVTHKVISFRVYKPQEYNPISKSERRRITRLVMRQLFNVATQFDGSSKMKVTFTARGNAWADIINYMMRLQTRLLRN